MITLSGVLLGVIITVVTGGTVSVLIWAAIQDGKRQRENL
jgi:hypothetical protein